MLKQIGVDRNGFPIFEAKSPKKECNHGWADYDGPTSVQPGPNDSTQKESCTKCMKVRFKPTTINDRQGYG